MPVVQGLNVYCARFSQSSVLKIGNTYRPRMRSYLPASVARSQTPSRGWTQTKIQLDSFVFDFLPSPDDVEPLSFFPSESPLVDPDSDFGADSPSPPDFEGSAARL